MNLHKNGKIENIKFYKITFFDFHNEKAKYLINKWIIKSTHAVEDYVVSVNFSSWAQT